MTRTPAIPSLIAALLLTSCALLRGAARASTALTSSPTHVAELNKEVRPLEDATSHVWDSFSSEDTVTPAAQSSADKLIPEVETHQPASPNDDSGELDVATPDSELPVFTPSLNAYCRSGPDVNRSQISLAMKGQSYAIHGRDPYGTWYLICISASAKCWVSASTGGTSGDTSGVRVIRPTVTPVSAPASSLANCSQYTTPQSCAQHARCTWNRLVAPAVCQAK